MIKKRLVGLLSHAKKYIVFNVIWQWLSLLAQIVAVFSIAGLLQDVLFGTVSMQEMTPVFLVLLVCVIIRFMCEKMAANASYKASVDVKKILRKKIYEKMLRLGASYRDKVSTSEVMQVSTEGVEQLEIYFGKYLPQLFYSLLAPVTLFIILSPINMKASVVLLVCVPLIPISIVAVQKFAKKLLSKYWGIYTGLGDSFLENIQGLTTLKIYQADEKKTQDMDAEAQNFRKITMKVLTMQLNSISVMDIVAYGGAAVGMVVAVNEFLKGNLGFSGCIAIILLASEFFIPLRLLGSFFHIAMNGMAASDKIFAILDLEDPKRGEKEIMKGSTDMEVSHVRFGYDEDRVILKDINITIPSGKFISLVGESGCGKSTIAGLLCGKNRGFSGDIRIGGNPIEEITEESLMNNIVLVRHNSYLFKGTVAENLRMAKPSAGEEEMKAVLEKVNLLGFLNEQKGLETELLEKASNLSGGQCQRLGIARALLKDAPIYIFDEATSNIDIESEELIMDVIHELAKTKTVILISHRLANVVDSDKIYFLRGGLITEEGTHEELIRENKAYKKLYESQIRLENYGREEAVC